MYTGGRCCLNAFDIHQCSQITTTSILCSLILLHIRVVSCEFMYMLSDVSIFIRGQFTSLDYRGNHTIFTFI